MIINQSPKGREHVEIETKSKISKPKGQTLTCNMLGPACGNVEAISKPKYRTIPGWHHLSTTASFVLCDFRSVKDHHNSLHDSSLLKACVRQVVLAYLP